MTTLALSWPDFVTRAMRLQLLKEAELLTFGGAVTFIGTVHVALKEALRCTDADVPPGGGRAGDIGSDAAARC